MSQTVLVIKDETVLAVNGKEGASPQIKRLEKVELTGYGDPFSRWKEGIRTLQTRMELSSVRLVLPASMCTAKVLQLPWVKKKDLEAMAIREMQEAFRSEIMDYAVIESDKKTGIVLACGSVEEAILKQFLELCTELQITIKSVTIPMESLLRVMPRLDTYQEKTAIYLFFEDGAVTSVLSENGNYKYSSRSRLFSEAGTLDFGTEIVRNVSGIQQFHVASKSEYPITNVYYAGCPADVFEVSREQLQEMNLEINRIKSVKRVSLPNGEDCAEWIACIGAMLNRVRGLHDINLLSSYEKNSELEDKPTALWKHFLLPATVLACCLLVYGGVQLLNLRTQKKIEKTIAWIESEPIQKAYQEALDLEQEKAKLQQAIQQTEQVNKNKATYPKLNQQVVEKIQAAGGAGITSNISRYDAAKGEMTFEARSTAAIDIPSYIERLTQTNLFHSVNYTGYVFENNAYTLSLLCTMEEHVDDTTKMNEGGKSE